MTSSQRHLSAATRCAGLVFVSGQLALDATGVLVGSTIEQQTHQCLQNVQSVLVKEGLSMRDVAKVTVWLKDAEDFLRFDLAFSQFLGDHRPARSTVRADLMLGGDLVEIEAIAHA
jgi:2-iminobutanoate/2-iminopropanoate deaminase